MHGLQDHQKIRSGYVKLDQATSDQHGGRWNSFCYPQSAPPQFVPAPPPPPQQFASDSSNGQGENSPSSQTDASLPNLGPLPIAGLYPGLRGNWQVIGIVGYKHEKQTYKKKDGKDGSYFWFEMKDGEGGEIRVVGFDRQVDSYFGKVIERQEYVLSRAKLQKPKDKYNEDMRKCEIVLKHNSVLERTIQRPENAENRHEEVPVIARSTPGAAGSPSATPPPVKAESKTLRIPKIVGELENNLEYCRSQLDHFTTKLEELKAELNQDRKDERAGEVPIEDLFSKLGTS